MAGILVIAEARQGELREVSFELIGAALAVKPQAGGPVKVAIVDADAARHAAALGSDGVDEVLAVQSPLPDFEAHVEQRALEALIEQERPELIIAAHSIDALGFAPALAAAGGDGFDSDGVALRWDDGPVATRGAYGDKLLAEYDFPGKEATVLLLRVGLVSPAAPGSGSVPVREVEIDGLAERLLYTSDAADDPLCVVLGGRRIIKDNTPVFLVRYGVLPDRTHFSIVRPRHVDVFELLP